MRMRNSMPNFDFFPGARCLSRWNGGFSLICGRTQDKILNSEMGNSNYGVTEIDSISSHSQHNLEFCNSDFNARCTSAQSGLHCTTMVQWQLPFLSKCDLTTERNRMKLSNRKPAKHGKKKGSVTELDPQSKPTHSVPSNAALFSQTSIDFRQPFACVPYKFAESGEMFQPYGSHAVLNSNVPGLASHRVPLPRQPSDEELIYVNPKQYNGIVRRRQLRAKLEAQNKLIKGRKPYLHESRHLHAMRRVRGSGGRFVNTKQNHHSAPHSSSQRSENKISSTNTPSSDVSNMFCQNHSNYLNQNNYSGHTSYNGEVGGGNMHHLISTMLP